MGATQGSNKLTRLKMVKETGKCGYCPPNGGYDNKSSRIPKPDKYKNIDRKTIRK
jgi:hypothetical protein